MRENPKPLCRFAVKALLLLFALSLGISRVSATDPVVRVTTSLGPVDIQLLPQSAPRTVANFLRYADRTPNGFNGTFIHRSVPGFVIQGGGYITNSFADLGSSLFAVHIPKDPPVVNEFHLSNVRGTVAMAKLDGNPDSATSEWFVNLVDNSASADHTNGGYTVFGRVIGNGMNVIDAIAALPFLHDQSGGVPLHDFTGGTALPANLVNITVARLPGPKADFNRDGKPDLLWQNNVTGQRSIWTMNGAVHTGGANLPSVAVDWDAVGTDDFNNDAKPDVLWHNRVTGQSSIWLMNGTIRTGSVTLPNATTNWSIAATGDFNGDYKPDILWESTSGQHVLWLMNGTVHSGTVNLPVVTPQWKIVAVADFNRDYKSDIVWENGSTGEHGIWLMNGTARTGNATLPAVAAAWKVAGAGDFNSDAKADLLFQNSATGQRGVWLMNGTTRAGSANIGTVATPWNIRNR